MYFLQLGSIILIEYWHVVKFYYHLNIYVVVSTNQLEGYLDPFQTQG